MKKKNCSPLFLGEIINIMWLKSTRKDIFALLNFINNKIQKRGWGLGGRGKGEKGGRGGGRLPHSSIQYLGAAISPFKYDHGYVNNNNNFFYCCKQSDGSLISYSRK